MSLHDDRMIFEQYCNILSEGAVPDFTKPGLAQKNSIFTHAGDGKYWRAYQISDGTNPEQIVAGHPVDGPYSDAAQEPGSANAWVKLAEIQADSWINPNELKSKADATAGASGGLPGQGKEKEQDQTAWYGKPAVWAADQLQQGANRYTDPLGQWATGKIASGTKALFAKPKERSQGVFGYR